jgi:hypothetical protein
MHQKDAEYLEFCHYHVLPHHVPSAIHNCSYITFHPTELQQLIQTCITEHMTTLSFHKISLLRKASYFINLCLIIQLFISMQPLEPYSIHNRVARFGTQRNNTMSWIHKSSIWIKKQYANGQLTIIYNAYLKSLQGRFWHDLETESTWVPWSLFPHYYMYEYCHCINTASLVAKFITIILCL